MNRSDQYVVFAEERRVGIARMLQECKRVSVTDLCEMYHVSAATIRSDLREMQQAGQLTRTHGGAIPRSQTAYEAVTRDKSTQYVVEKKKIAEAADKLIHDGDSILLDTGTTTLELARRLLRRRGLKVLTNDLDIVRLLEDSSDSDTEVFVLGGLLRRGFRCTIGYQGLAHTGDFHVDKAFLGTNAFSLQAGATTPSVQHAETKKAMMAMANQTILLCDSSKFGQIAFARFASADEFDVLICDAIDSSSADQLRELGVDLILASS